MAIFDNFKDPDNVQPGADKFTDEDLYNGFISGDGILTELFIAKVKKDAAELEAAENKK
jgi:hypothetical protein